MGTVNVVGSIDMLRDFMGWMLGGIKMLTAEIGQPPVFWKLGNELIKPCKKVGCESCVVFEDDIRIDAVWLKNSAEH